MFSVLPVCADLLALEQASAYQAGFDFSGKISMFMGVEHL
jgi:hypothetical protein